MSSDKKLKAKVGRPSTGNGSIGQVQSLSRGLILLEKVSEANGALTVDLAIQVGLPVSTVHRLLNTLETQGFVRREVANDLWFVGVAGFKIGNAFLANRDFVRQAKPFMKGLVESVGETSNLSILQNGKAVILAQQQCTEMMRMMVPLGSSSPLHASGVGKAILSSLSDEEVKLQLAAIELKQITGWTITSKQGLEKELTKTRVRGWAFDDQEHAIGLRCVAACLYNEAAYPIAAISVSGPIARINDSRAQYLGEKVKKVAKEITLFIGGVWPSEYC